MSTNPSDLNIDIFFCQQIDPAQDLNRRVIEKNWVRESNSSRYPAAGALNRSISCEPWSRERIWFFWLPVRKKPVATSKATPAPGRGFNMPKS